MLSPTLAAEGRGRKQVVVAVDDRSAAAARVPVDALLAVARRACDREGATLTVVPFGARTRPPWRAGVVTPLADGEAVHAAAGGPAAPEGPAHAPRDAGGPPPTP